MKPFSVVQVSDAHLSPEHAFPTENWKLVAAHVNELGPDLVVHTGDTTVDGVGDPEQLAFAKEQLALLDAEVLVVPGNHDVGEVPSHANRLEPMVSAESCARFESCFGQDRFVRDVQGWRLVGLNALLFGSELRIEKDLWTFLDEALSSAEERRVAVFLHKPLFATAPGDGSRGAHYLDGESAERLHRTLRDGNAALVATGHLHEHRAEELEGIQYVWAPSTSFVTDEILRSPLGTPRVGFVHHQFGPDSVSSTVVCPDDMTTHRFLDHPEFYPEFQEAARRFLEWKRSTSGD
ncbi:MAG: metallophosphoesterase [Myxococcota bacterium]|nr:metallophosphoesterase [Myxococcota bacterium]